RPRPPRFPPPSRQSLFHLARHRPHESRSPLRRPRPFRPPPRPPPRAPQLPRTRSRLRRRQRTLQTPPQPLARLECGSLAAVFQRPAKPRNKFARRKSLVRIHPFLLSVLSLPFSPPPRPTPQCPPTSPSWTSPLTPAAPP